MSVPEKAPSGLDLREDMSLAEYYSDYPWNLPSGFEPINFPPRECRPVTRRFSRKEIEELIKSPDWF